MPGVHFGFLAPSLLAGAPLLAAAKWGPGQRGAGQGPSGRERTEGMQIRTGVSLPHDPGDGGPWGKGRGVPTREGCRRKGKAQARGESQRSAGTGKDTTMCQRRRGCLKSVGGGGQVIHWNCWGVEI